MFIPCLVLCGLHLLCFLLPSLCYFGPVVFVNVND